MTPDSSLSELAARLPLLTRAEHPLAMKKSRAEAFVQAANATGDLPKALAESGAAPVLAQILASARPSDGARVLLKLVPMLGEVAALRRTLRGAIAYPLALLFTIGLGAWALFTISIPAFELLSWNHVEAQASPVPLELLICGTCLAAMVSLGALASRGMAIPLLTRGVAVLDRALVLETAAALVEAQVLLPIAIGASALWSDARVRENAAAIARAFDSGTSAVDVAPLLDAEAAGILCSSAQRAVVGPVLRTLAQQALIEAQCELPRELRRVQSFALALAGVALCALASCWLHVYLHALG